ncbi:hypothetical protein WM40_27045 [Robbsia andropogonis]|uniref:Large polyvalent protein associated domain-containing protein n=1 Tax=Robbsia andropogonis TaxID=28092 RepID=A0A0F5JT21_9BURK|nr:LPD29 domain-containing protein [Robbsia andropogonis]KKB60809.1 hypothetical protein WM40_27045 [Robbsia andropogonis]
MSGTSYLSCADTAKLVRASLKEAFPQCRFSVRSSTYAGGASISIRWTDGPNHTQVEFITGKFAGSYFDGSIDYKGSIFHLLDGAPVHMGADSIHLSRSYSEGFIEAAIGRVYRRFLGNFQQARMGCPSAHEYRRGALWAACLPGLHDWNHGNLQREIDSVLHKHTFCLTVEKSKTAGRIFVTHDDGYSRSCGSGMSAVDVGS